MINKCFYELMGNNEVNPKTLSNFLGSLHKFRKIFIIFKKCRFVNDVRTWIGTKFVCKAAGCEFPAVLSVVRQDFNNLTHLCSLDCRCGCLGRFLRRVPAYADRSAAPPAVASSRCPRRQNTGLWTPDQWLPDR